MDLNLYLGLPHSPIRGGSDLGSDLALGSIPLLSEEIRSSTEMPGVVEALDSHAPYSPTHASYSSNQDAVEPLDSSGIRIPRFEYSPYDPPTSYGLVSQLPNNERNGSSRLEYCQYAPNYIPALLDIQQTGNESSHPDANAPLGHVPYSPSYAPVSTTEQASREPVVVEDDNGHVEYVPRSPAYNPEMPAPASPQQPNGVLVLEDVDPYVPSSPSYVPISTTGQDRGRPVALEDGNNDIEYVPTSPTINLVTAPASPQPNGSLIAEDVDPYVPSSPSFIPFMPTTQVPADRTNNEISQPSGAVSQLQRTMQNIEPLAIDDSSDEGIMQYRQNRLRRLIESHQRLRPRRFRSTASYRVDPPYGASSLSLEDHMLQESMASERVVETSGTRNHKVGAESLVVGDTEEETKDQDSGAANFECNICLDMAKEPVVTSCGHLFCWPCLYQWIHLHCDHKECPVCKGEVTDSNITPIYGRGSTVIGVEKTDAHEGDSSLKIPPRPRGHRCESSRQIRRPSSRRLGHELSSWRRIFDEGNRAEGQESPLPSIFDVSNNRVFTRLRAAQRFRREGSSENVLNLVGATGLPRNTAETALNSQSGSSQADGHHGGSRSSPALPDSFDFWQRFALFSLPGLPSSDRLAVTASLSSVMERMTGIASHSGASASVNPQNAEPLHNQGTQGATPGADQASSSSTMAVIQGDAGVVNATAEASGAGSSRSLRRRRRSGASSSLDLDGGVHHAHKRRRIN